MREIKKNNNNKIKKIKFSAALNDNILQGWDGLFPKLIMLEMKQSSKQSKVLQDMLVIVLSSVLNWVSSQRYFSVTYALLVGNFSFFWLMSCIWKFFLLQMAEKSNTGGRWCTTTLFRFLLCLWTITWWPAEKHSSEICWNGSCDAREMQTWNNRSCQSLNRKSRFCVWDPQKGSAQHKRSQQCLRGYYWQLLILQVFSGQSLISFPSLSPWVELSVLGSKECLWGSGSPQSVVRVALWC